jgi:hypothetical protein
MKKFERRFWSLIPGVIAMTMTFLIDPKTIILLPLMPLGVHFYSIGILYLTLTGLLFVYWDPSGLYSLATVTLAFMAISMGRLDREKAPLGDYGVITATGLLVFPTYFILRALTPFLAGIEATVLAVLLIVTIYFFIKSIAS